METYTNTQLPPDQRLWPRDEEPLYPFREEVLNGVLAQMGIPMVLPRSEWETFLNTLRTTTVPFSERYIPETIILHIGHGLRKYAEAKGGWEEVKAELEEARNSFRKGVTTQMHQAETVAAIYGSREAMTALRKAARERRKALPTPGVKGTPENRSSPPPIPKEKQETSSQGARREAVEDPTPAPQGKGGTATANPPQPGGEDKEGALKARFPELYAAYKEGLLGRLAWHSGIRQATQDLVEKALKPIGSTLETLKGKGQGEDTKALLEELAKEQRQLAERLQALEEALAELANRTPGTQEERLLPLVQGLATVVRSLVQHVAELQALAFGPARRPPLIPQEGLRMLEALATQFPDPSTAARWLRQRD